MSTSIIKLNKNNGQIIDLMPVNIDGTAFSISNYLDAWSNDSSIIPFNIQVSSSQIPFLDNPDFYLAIREKIDLTANNVYNKDITFEDKDIGQNNYKNESPYQPRYLPNGFTELKGT